LVAGAFTRLDSTGAATSAESASSRAFNSFAMSLL